VGGGGSVGSGSGGPASGTAHELDGWGINVRLGARSAPGRAGSSSSLACALLDALQRGLPTRSACGPFTPPPRTTRCWGKKSGGRCPVIGNTSPDRCGWAARRPCSGTATIVAHGGAVRGAPSRGRRGARPPCRSSSLAGLGGRSPWHFRGGGGAVRRTSPFPRGGEVGRKDRRPRRVLDARAHEDLASAGRPVAGARAGERRPPECVHASRPPGPPVLPTDRCSHPRTPPGKQAEQRTVLLSTDDSSPHTAGK